MRRSERADAARAGHLLLPLLVLPALVGALLLAVFPSEPDGMVLVIGSSAVLAWFLLGGSISVASIWGRLAVHRACNQLRAAIADIEGPAFIIGPGGAILDQNEDALARAGDLVGQKIHHLLGRRYAEPERMWSDIGISLGRSGRSAADLGALGDFFISREAGSELQLWQLKSNLKQIRQQLSVVPSDDFASLPVSLLRLTAEGKILSANASARELLGPHVEGQTLSALFDGLGRNVSDWVGDVSMGRMKGSAEVLHFRTDGADRYVQISLSPATDGLVTAVLSDVSELKTLEAQFVQSQKMQAIGQLAGGIAHDFNNLLTAIRGHCDLLMLRHDRSDPDYADLDQISQNTNRAAALVRQLLAFSRKQMLRLQPLDLRETLSDLTHLLNRLVGERIILTFEHHPALRTIRADRRQLEQVIMNLVVNARDAMPQGGNITIATDNISFADPTEIGRAILPAGEYVRVSVRDQGCGISPDILAKIFEPFYTTKRTGEGTGLGLSTAYGIVKQTGGYIFCDSTPGEGSNFALYFPAHEGEIVAQDETPSAPAPISRPRREMDATVLLVEDEAPVRAFASRALKLQGFKVLEAACAEDALDILTDPEVAVDIFVTDVVMPGMDGPTWVRAALKDRPETRVVFMSGYAEDVFTEDREPIPGSTFLAKPFSLSDLTTMVASQVEREAPPATP
ncbi:two-component system cell cycle sensor histidine kinase/response regulator CckA [Paracoccus sulfuroxidans]|uniref:histidine kinase n=2 Tax=Paracoccus sulfuroxidans TaxID=384678 RepID=A0A562NS25_9RHOB|nr:two-component system cell cycle sensor histidine kinase/response regulator CckA [Paracoccus sulfuroxidans]